MPASTSPSAVKATPAAASAASPTAATAAATPNESPVSDAVVTALRRGVDPKARIVLGFPAQNVTQALQTNLPAEVSIIDLTRATAQQVSLWQTDRYARRTVLECMKAAAGTLASLVKLVSSLENMVVLESIQRQVEDAIAALDAAWTDLHRADPDVPRAFESARTAVFRAEQAFFDPTMVALLYFPDEHKYAVFVPLFVPISVPVLISLVREIKRRRDLARRRRLALAYEKAQRAAREHPGAGADADATAEAPAPPAPSMS
ncbi:hypothetical protein CAUPRSCDRAFT_11974 [Caulochytrium protostelioides]|uniref:GPI transamidase component PIG-S n=1 Tax=Caulochytrium protostelioides TaxID=1555241 RepID=A0A4P9WT30_9FUNG|nr:hypothetical protein CAUPRSCDRAFT_11974 [Caulochytrium protostelioides]